MTEEFDPRLRDHLCFGCGRHNALGMHLVFEPDGQGDGVVARYTPRPEDQGFPGVMHGGLVSLLLDEAMGWALYGERVFTVTATMETRYRRPVRLDAPLLVRGRVTERRGRRIRARATLHADDGTDDEGALLVEASALLLRMPPEQEAATLAAIEAGRLPGAEGPGG